MQREVESKVSETHMYTLITDRVQTWAFWNGGKDMILCNGRGPLK